MKTRKLIFILLTTMLIFVTTQTPSSASSNSNLDTVVPTVNEPIFTEDELKSFFLPEYISSNARAGWPSTYTSTTIYTTDGTSVPARIYQEMSSNERNELNAYITQNFSNITKIAEPSYKYNCHAYAWYYQNYSTISTKLAANENVYFNQYPTLFMNDDHTISILNPNNVQVGDVVVYWAEPELDDNGVGDLEPVHSAIVYSINSNGDITCISKWGYYGLYIHHINNVPDGYISTSGVQCTYYRYTQGEHGSFVYSSAGGTYHTAVCLKCNDSFLEVHTLNEDNTLCTKCLYTGPFSVIMRNNSIAALPHTYDEYLYSHEE